MVDCWGAIVAEYKSRVDKILSLAGVVSSFKDWHGDFDLSDITQEALNVYKEASRSDIKYKAWTILKDILTRYPQWFEGEQNWILKELPSIDQKALFTDYYKEMIEFCFGYTLENIEFSEGGHSNVKEVLCSLDDKSLLRGIRDAIVIAAIDYGWKDIIKIILNDDSFYSLKEETKYRLFDYFYADANQFHSELSMLFKRVEINLSSSFAGIICRDEETYLDGLSSVHIGGLPFLISHYPSPRFLLALYSSPETVVEVLEHQKQWIQMMASQISEETVGNNVNRWSLYNGLMSDNRGLVTDVDDFLIGICNSLLKENRFYEIALPLIVLKDEEKIEPREDNKYNLLGEYVAEKQEVILYGRAISNASYDLDVDEKILRAVVLIHELGHYITHAHPLNYTYEEPFDDALFSDSDACFLECIAQLFAYWVTNCDKKYHSYDVFDKLASKQSGPYKEYLKHTNESPDMILKAIAV